MSKQIKKNLLSPRKQQQNGSLANFAPELMIDPQNQHLTSEADESLLKTYVKYDNSSNQEIAMVQNTTKNDQFQVIDANFLSSDINSNMASTLHNPAGDAFQSAMNAVNTLYQSSPNYPKQHLKGSQSPEDTHDSLKSANRNQGLASNRVPVLSQKQTLTLEYPNEGSKDEPLFKDNQHSNDEVEHDKIDAGNQISMKRKDKSMYIGGQEIGLGMGNNISVSIQSPNQEELQSMDLTVDPIYDQLIKQRTPMTVSPSKSNIKGPQQPKMMMVSPKEFIEIKQRQQFLTLDDQNQNRFPNRKNHDSQLNVAEIQSPKSGTVQYSQQARPSKILRQTSNMKMNQGPSPPREDDTSPRKSELRIASNSPLAHAEAIHMKDFVNGMFVGGAKVKSGFELDLSHQQVKSTQNKNKLIANGAKTHNRRGSNMYEQANNDLSMVYESSLLTGSNRNNQQPLNQNQSQFINALETQEIALKKRASSKMIFSQARAREAAQQIKPAHPLRQVDISKSIKGDSISRRESMGSTSPMQQQLQNQSINKNAKVEIKQNNMNVDALVSQSPMNIDEGQFNSAIDSLKHEEQFTTLNSPLRFTGHDEQTKIILKADDIDKQKLIPFNPKLVESKSISKINIKLEPEIIQQSGSQINSFSKLRNNQMSNTRLNKQNSTVLFPVLKTITASNTHINKEGSKNSLGLKGQLTLNGSNPDVAAGMTLLNSHSSLKMIGGIVKQGENSTSDDQKDENQSISIPKVTMEGRASQKSDKGNETQPDEQEQSNFLNKQLIKAESINYINLEIQDIYSPQNQNSPKIHLTNNQNSQQFNIGSQKSILKGSMRTSQKDLLHSKGIAPTTSIKVRTTHNQMVQNSSMKTLQDEVDPTPKVNPSDFRIHETLQINSYSPMAEAVSPFMSYKYKPTFSPKTDKYQISIKNILQDQGNIKIEKGGQRQPNISEFRDQNDPHAIFQINVNKHRIAQTKVNIQNMVEVKFDRTQPSGDLINLQQDVVPVISDHTRTGFNATKTNFMRASRTKPFIKSVNRYENINQQTYKKSNSPQRNIGINGNFIAGLPNNMGQHLHFSYSSQRDTIIPSSNINSTAPPNNTVESAGNGQSKDDPDTKTLTSLSPDYRVVDQDAHNFSNIGTQVLKITQQPKPPKLSINNGNVSNIITLHQTGIKKSDSGFDIINTQISKENDNDAIDQQIQEFDIGNIFEGKSKLDRRHDSRSKVVDTPNTILYNNKNSTHLEHRTFQPGLSPTLQHVEQPLHEAESTFLVKNRLNQDSSKILQVVGDDLNSHVTKPVFAKGNFKVMLQSPSDIQLQEDLKDDEYSVTNTQNSPQAKNNTEIGKMSTLGNENQKDSIGNANNIDQNQEEVNQVKPLLVKLQSSPITNKSFHASNNDAQSPLNQQNSGDLMKNRSNVSPDQSHQATLISRNNNPHINSLQPFRSFDDKLKQPALNERPSAFLEQAAQDARVEEDQNQVNFDAGQGKLQTITLSNSNSNQHSNMNIGFVSQPSALMNGDNNQMMKPRHHELSLEGNVQYPNQSNEESGIQTIIRTSGNIQEVDYGHNNEGQIQKIIFPVIKKSSMAPSPLIANYKELGKSTKFTASSKKWKQIRKDIQRSGTVVLGEKSMDQSFKVDVSASRRSKDVQDENYYNSSQQIAVSSNNIRGMIFERKSQIKEPYNIPIGDFTQESEQFMNNGSMYNESILKSRLQNFSKLDQLPNNRAIKLPQILNGQDQYRYQMKNSINGNFQIKHPVTQRNLNQSLDAWQKNSKGFNFNTIEPFGDSSQFISPLASMKHVDRQVNRQYSEMDVDTEIANGDLNQSSLTSQYGSLQYKNSPFMQNPFQQQRYMNHSNHAFKKGASGSPITINDQRNLNTQMRQTGAQQLGFGNSAIQHRLSNKVFVPSNIGIKPVHEIKQEYQKREKFMSPSKSQKPRKINKRNYQVSQSLDVSRLPSKMEHSGYNQNEHKEQELRKMFMDTFSNLLVNPKDLSDAPVPSFSHSLNPSFKTIQHDVSIARSNFTSSVILPSLHGSTSKLKLGSYQERFLSKQLAEKLQEEYQNSQRFHNQNLPKNIDMVPFLENEYKQNKNVLDAQIEMGYDVKMDKYDIQNQILKDNQAMQEIQNFNEQNSRPNNDLIPNQASHRESRLGNTQNKFDGSGIQTHALQTPKMFGGINSVTYLNPPMPIHLKDKTPPVVEKLDGLKLFSELRHLNSKISISKINRQKIQKEQKPILNQGMNQMKHQILCTNMATNPSISNLLEYHGANPLKSLNKSKPNNFRSRDIIKLNPSFPLPFLNGDIDYRNSSIQNTISKEYSSGSGAPTKEMIEDVENLKVIVLHQWSNSPGVSPGAQSLANHVNNLKNSESTKSKLPLTNTLHHPVGDQIDYCLNQATIDEQSKPNHMKSRPDSKLKAPFEYEEDHQLKINATQYLATKSNANIQQQKSNANIQQYNKSMAPKIQDFSNLGPVISPQGSRKQLKLSTTSLLKAATSRDALNHKLKGDASDSLALKQQDSLNSLNYQSKNEIIALLGSKTEHEHQTSGTIDIKKATSGGVVSKQSRNTLNNDLIMFELPSKGDISKTGVAKVVINEEIQEQQDQMEIAGNE